MHTIFFSENLRSTKICSNFASDDIDLSMEQETEWMKVTDDERELIESIRNYNKSFPNGYPQLLWFAQQLFDNMLRQPYE